MKYKLELYIIVIMSILKIARLGHPLLQKKSSIVKNFPQPSIKKLINDMTETMLDAKGIGLAAPQVHISKQIIIFRISNRHYVIKVFGCRPNQCRSTYINVFNNFSKTLFCFYYFFERVKINNN